LPARAFLFSLEQIGIKLGLDQIRALVAELGHPERAFPSIVVAGTNGKGSVTAMVERGLRAAGYRTGRYTSPHLVQLEERFALDGEPISSEELERAAARVQGAATRLPAPPSFFEATTALALEVFRHAGVEVAVLEVGLGGRLDATNVVHPVGVAITSIDFDHQQYLGNTIDAIAGEKAGVIKPGCFVVLADNPPSVRGVVERASAAARAELVVAPDQVDVRAVYQDGRARLDLRTPAGRYDDVTLGLRGRHQVDNAVTAVRLLEGLAARGLFVISPAAIRSAISDALWPGRLELVAWRGHEVLLDGAHNPAGARALCRYVLDTYGRTLPFVIGVMRDKDASAMAGALSPAACAFICTAPDASRAMRPADLAAVVRGVAPGVPVIECRRPADAIAHGAAWGSPVVAAGSLYLVGEIRGQIS
jgi:dihydrofolate synthase/folylpolyglutamate synthase